MGVYGLNWALALIVAPSLSMELLAYDPAVLWLGYGFLGVIAALIISTDVRSAGLPLVPEVTANDGAP